LEPKQAQNTPPKPGTLPPSFLPWQTKIAIIHLHSKTYYTSTWSSADKYLQTVFENLAKLKLENTETLIL